MDRNELIKSTAYWMNWFEDEIDIVKEITDFLYNTGNIDEWARIDDDVEEISQEKIIKILKSTSWNEVIKFCLRISQLMPIPVLYNKVLFFYDKDVPLIEISTRKKLISLLPESFCGTGSRIKFLSRYFYISPYKSSKAKPSIYAQLVKIVDVENKWSKEKLFDYVGTYKCATRTFRGLIVAVLDPKFRSEEENSKLVKAFNEILINDGCNLVPDRNKSVHNTYYKFIQIKKPSNISPQRLIFGAKGVKPNFGITDVLDGDINLVDNNGNALIYQNEIEDRLNWSDLLKWWNSSNYKSDISLNQRLIESLDSPPEILFFKSYFSLFQTKLGDKLPALIPQVYIAYDPMRAKDLEVGKTRIRQRIDFLMILPNLKRVIIEIDGKQHYADEDGRANPRKYAEMVRVDRDLRLRGYEVYRFGGAEFYNDQNSPEKNAAMLVKDFFSALFKQHEIS